MAEYLIQDTTLIAIGDAVRTKTEKTDLIPVSKLADEILSISTGGGYVLVVNTSAGASVTASKDNKTYSGTADSDGVAILQNLTEGTWTVNVTDGSISKTTTVEIVEHTTINVSLNTVPAFTYDGDYEIVDDNDNPITFSSDNWKIRFLTSGTLTFTKLNGAADGIDVFCVGGGGNAVNTGRSGAGGGYTATKRNVSVEANTILYEIVVGGAAGASSAFNVSVSGGKSQTNINSYRVRAGNGGSGGGYGAANGGRDGSNGFTDGSLGEYQTEPHLGGTGQGTTTREFGEEGARLYAGGGAGYGYDNAGSWSATSGGEGGGGNSNCNGKTNTGGGAGAGPSHNMSGGSGIVIIRNAR